MTTDNTTPDNGLASFEDTMAALREGRSSHPLHSVRISGNYDGGSARVAVAGAVLSAGDDEAIAAERAAAGVSLAGVETDIASLSKRIAFLDEQLGRVAYDSRTGAQVSTLPAHIAAAHKVERESLAEELAVAQRTREMVLSRKAAEAAKQQTINEVETAEQEWVNYDPRRAQILKDAKERLEAEALAKWSLSKRYNIG
jgi:hypothetical protein